MDNRGGMGGPNRTGDEFKSYDQAEFTHELQGLNQHRGEEGTRVTASRFVQAGGSALNFCNILIGKGMPRKDAVGAISHTIASSNKGGNHLDENGIEALFAMKRKDLHYDKRGVFYHIARVRQSDIKAYKPSTDNWEFLYY